MSNRVTRGVAIVAAVLLLLALIQELRGHRSTDSVAEATRLSTHFPRPSPGWQAAGRSSLTARAPEPPPFEREPANPLVREACSAIAGKLGSVTRDECLARGLQPSGALSVEGRPILVREYPPLERRAPLGRVLLVGGIHGDEFSSVSIVFKWMSTLDRFHSGLFHWRIGPLLNPDGLLRAESQRLNANGVDLNRNFPSPNWWDETRDYWVRRTSRNPRRYPGPGALSEPESRWLADEIQRFRPDVVVSVHAPYSVLDFDGPPHAPDRLGPLRLNLLGTYPGSLGRFAGVQGGLPVVTIELPSAGIMPSEVEQQAMWSDLIDWLRKRLGEDASPVRVTAR